MAGLLTGGRVVRFNVLTLRPQVRIDGPADRTGRALRAVGGSALVVLTAVLWILAIPGALLRRTELEAICFFPLIESIAWLVSALTYPGGEHNDVWKFIRASGVESWPVAATAAVVLWATFTLYQYKVRSAASIGITLRP